MTATSASLVERARGALLEFMRLEAAGGLVLMAAAVLAMITANSPLSGWYDALLSVPLSVSVGDFGISKPLLLWINDGLMAVFFFLVGMELKREVMEGHLASLGQASLPAWERADRATQLLVEVIAILIYLVTSLLLLLQQLMRLALVDVLLVVSPLALLCWVLPQTQGWARLWSSTFFGAVFAQFVQVLTLKLGGALLTELTPMAADAALLAVFLGVAVLALTLKIPSLLRQHAGDGLGFLRFYAYRHASRALDHRTGATGAGGGRGGA